MILIKTIMTLLILVATAEFMVTPNTKIGDMSKKNFDQRDRVLIGIFLMPTVIIGLIYIWDTL